MEEEGKFAIMDTDNLIEIFDTHTRDHVETIRTSVFGYGYDLIYLQDKSFLVTQLSHGGLAQEKRPSMVQKVYFGEKRGKWIIENLIGEQPGTDILEHPVWCPSNQYIFAFDNYIYQWETESGEYLRKKNLPKNSKQIHQCVVFNDKLYMTGKSNDGDFMIFILDSNSMRVENEYFYKKQPEDWLDQDAVLWIQESIS